MGFLAMIVAACSGPPSHLDLEQDAAPRDAGPEADAALSPDAAVCPDPSFDWTVFWLCQDSPDDCTSDWGVLATLNSAWLTDDDFPGRLAMWRADCDYRDDPACDNWIPPILEYGDETVFGGSTYQSLAVDGFTLSCSGGWWRGEVTATDEESAQYRLSVWMGVP